MMPTIQELRAQRGWSRETLAGKAHISAHTIERIERGKTKRPIPLVIAALAEAFGVKPEEIIMSQTKPGAG